jgi:transposase
VRVFHGEGVASHTGPESCAAAREDRGEALTGECVGQPSSGENHLRGADAFRPAEGNTAVAAARCVRAADAPGRRHIDREVAAILTRLRRARVICSDETTVRINGRTCWNWVFQNEAVVIHVVRPTRAAAVVNEVLDGHRPAFWVSDLYGGQRGHADLWQICLAHQLRDCQYAIEAGDAVFAPRMKKVLLRAVVLARRRHDLAASTRREYRRRLDRELDAIIALAPENRHGKRLRQRYAKVRDHLFTFLDHPEVPPDNNGCERELRPTATYRKVTGGFRSVWGADLFAGVKSVLGTAARHGLDAYQAIRQTLCGHSILDPG